jgi:F-type H+-transporting ATPase subunit epsilon
MAGSFKLEVATPERLVLSADVMEAQIPGQHGYLGVLPQHAPLISALAPGELTYRHNGNIERLAVSLGYVEVLPDRVSVLAETAEKAEEIDVERATRSRQRAQDRLAKPHADTDIRRATVALQRALARLRVAGKR